jgi:hypothetical protein
VRLCSPDGHRAVFLLGFGLSAGAAVAAWFIIETRCRNVWRSATA